MKDHSLSVAILFAIVLIVIINFVFKNSRFGYRVRACGGNRLAAETAGINSRRITIPVSYTHLGFWMDDGHYQKMQDFMRQQGV